MIIYSHRIRQVHCRRDDERPCQCNRRGNKIEGEPVRIVAIGLKDKDIAFFQEQTKSESGEQFQDSGALVLRGAIDRDKKQAATMIPAEACASMTSQAPTPSIATCSP